MMKDYIQGWSLLWISILLIVSSSYSLALSAEFTADYNEQFGDNTKTGKIYVKNSKYCLDLTNQGENIIIIVNSDIGKTIAIQVSKKEYRELATDDMISIMNDPFQGYIFTEKNGEIKNAGTETINGYECNKTVVTMGDTEVMSQWKAKSLNFPIKIVAYSSPLRTVELTNIVEGSVDDSKFEIPKGFKKWIDPATLPIEPPEWADKITSAPLLVPPFEQDVSTGDIIRIKVEPGKSLALKGVSKTDDNAVAEVIPFKDGRPIIKLSRNNNFAMKEIICSRSHETNVEADEFIIYVYEGEIKITAKWIDMLEKTVSAGEKIELPLPTWDKIETRSVNLFDGESVAVISYYENGKELSEDVMGPVKWRTITLKERGDVKAVTLSQKGDKIVFSVKKGKMLIKLGQFDSFKF